MVASHNIRRLIPLTIHHNINPNNQRREGFPRQSPYIPQPQPQLLQGYYENHQDVRNNIMISGGRGSGSSGEHRSVFMVSAVSREFRGPASEQGDRTVQYRDAIGSDSDVGSWEDQNSNLGSDVVSVSGDVVVAADGVDHPDIVSPLEDAVQSVHVQMTRKDSDLYSGQSDMNFGRGNRTGSRHHDMGFHHNNNPILSSMPPQQQGGMMQYNSGGNQRQGVSHHIRSHTQQQHQQHPSYQNLNQNQRQLQQKNSQRGRGQGQGSYRGGYQATRGHLRTTNQVTPGVPQGNQDRRGNESYDHHQRGQMMPSDAIQQSSNSSRMPQKSMERGVENAHKKVESPQKRLKSESSDDNHNTTAAASINSNRERGNSSDLTKSSKSTLGVIPSYSSVASGNNNNSSNSIVSITGISKSTNSIDISTSSIAIGTWPAQDS